MSVLGRVVETRAKLQWKQKNITTGYENEREMREVREMARSALQTMTRWTEKRKLENGPRAEKYGGTVDEMSNTTQVRPKSGETRLNCTPFFLSSSSTTKEEPDHLDDDDRR